MTALRARAFRARRLCGGGAALVAAIMMIIAMAGSSPAPAQSDIYEVKGVQIEAEDEDAAKAKIKAISQAQEKAFAILLDRLVAQGAAERAPEIPTADIARAMGGISIANERTGPKQYIAEFTVRFRPDAVKQLLSQYNLSFSAEQAPTTLLLAVYKSGEAAVLWEEPNPWRNAWTQLSPENSITPILLPLGDFTDADLITARDVIENRTDKIEQIKKRYNVEFVLISIAEPNAEGTALTATISGNSPVGNVDWQDRFTGEPDDDLAAIAEDGAKRFLGAIEQNWRAIDAQQVNDDGSAFTMAVPFRTVAEWRNIREEIEGTYGVTRVETRTLSGQGAIVDVYYRGPLDQLSADLQQRGLILAEGGETLVLYRE